MRNVAFDTLARDLRAYVDMAAAGEVVQVLVQDRVVVELRAPAPTRGDDSDWFARAVAEGKIVPAENLEDPLPEPAPRLPLRQILADLDDDRADR